MYGVIEKRRQYLGLVRQITLDRGYFTITDLQEGAEVPRSTAQDWINRLLAEGCIIILREKRGRHPARYGAISAMPSSACRRIFTAVDGDRVEIYHECLSGACAAFCGFHHRMAGGVLTRVEKDGTLLRECARLGKTEVGIGLYPAPAVGVTGVEREGDLVIQRIRCIGGPAYSVTDMIGQAHGVIEVRLKREGEIVEGEIYTKALTHLTIGIDDTDTKERGATFALSLALLQHLGGIRGVFPITHRIAMLNPGVPSRTAGNSCSYIEIAAEPGDLGRLKEKAVQFVSDETSSPEWGVAVREGFIIPAELRQFGKRAREAIVTEREALDVAGHTMTDVSGGRGVIGALAAVSLLGLDHDILLDPSREIPA